LVGFLRLPVRATLGKTKASGTNTVTAPRPARRINASFSHGDQPVTGVVEVGNALQYSVPPAMMSPDAVTRRGPTGTRPY